MDRLRRADVDVRQPLPVAGGVMGDDVFLVGVDVGGPL